MATSGVWEMIYIQSFFFPLGTPDNRYDNYEVLQVYFDKQCLSKKQNEQVFWRQQQSCCGHVHVSTVLLTYEVS